MKKSTQSLVVLWALVSATTAPAIEPGYYTLQSLPTELRPLNYDQAVAASSFRIRNCSTFAVSPTGYIVTALHCITHCFRSATDVLFPETSSTTKKSADGTTLYSLFRALGLGTGSRTCDSSTFDLYDQNAQVVGSKPRLVAFGTGYPSFDEKAFQSAEFTAQDAKLLASNFRDWAILKYEPTRPLECVKIAKSPVTIGERVWAIGYPARTTRTGVPGAAGGTQVVSYGSVSNNVYENQYYRELNFDERAYRLAQKTYLESGETFLSDMDIFSGNSGSISINENGEAVGVNVAIATSSGLASGTYYRNIALTQKIGPIVQQLKSLLSRTEFDQVFNCSTSQP